MYRSIGHMEFPNFQTQIFVEWRAPYEILKIIHWTPWSTKLPFFFLEYSLDIVQTAHQHWDPALGSSTA